MDQADLERRLRRHLRAQAGAVPSGRDAARAALLARLDLAAGERPRRPWPARLARPLLAAAALAACVAVALLLGPATPAPAPVRPTTAPTARPDSQEAGGGGAEAASASGSLSALAGLVAGDPRPAAGPPGTRLLLRGAGCPAGAGVRVLATRTADRSAAGTELGTIAVTADGAWSGSVQVPAAAAPGPLWLWLECAGRPGPPARAGPLRFDVTAP